MYACCMIACLLGQGVRCKFKSPTAPQAAVFVLRWQIRKALCVATPAPGYSIGQLCPSRMPSLAVARGAVCTGPLQHDPRAG